MQIRVALLIFFCSASAFAQSYYVAPVNGRSASELSESVRELVITAVTESGNSTVKSADQADFVLEASMISLRGAQVVTLKKKKGSKTVFSSRMKAENAEELDVVVTRLTQAVMNERRPEDNPTVGNLTDQESDQLVRRTESRAYRYFSLGPAGFTQVKNSHLVTTVAGGYLWEVSPNAAIRAHGTFSAVGQEQTFYFAGILGMNYYFSPTSQSVFVNGGLGYGFSWALDSHVGNASGFAIGGGLGFIFFRTAATQMSVEARYEQLLDTNKIGSPGQYGVLLGIHY